MNQCTLKFISVTNQWDWFPFDFRFEVPTLNGSSAAKGDLRNPRFGCWRDWSLERCGFAFWLTCCQNVKALHGQMVPKSGKTFGESWDKWRFIIVVDATWIFFLGESGIFFPNKFLTLGHKIPRDSPTFWIPKVLLPAVGIIHMDFRLKSTVPDFFAKKPGKNPKGWDFLWKGQGFMKPWPW